MGFVPQLVDVLILKHQTWELHGDLRQTDEKSYQMQRTC